MITKAQLQGSGQDFKFWMPFDSIEKAKDPKTGKTKMVVKGIASTDDKDADEETLLPKGFHLDHLMNYGFINWHHQSKKTPRAIIGEPTKAEIINKGKALYVEAELYDTDLGKAVYEFANTLQKAGSKRKLGWSIEGKAIERDPKDEKIVRKAAITDIAITPAPKNAKTFVDVVKGHFFNEDWEFDVDDNDNLVDVIRPNGDRMTITKAFEINISKAQDTTNTAALIKESLEGSEKKDENSDDKNKKDKTSKINNKKDMKHTEEQISKAAEVLGMSKEDLQKGLNTEASAQVKEDLEKAKDAEEEEEEEETEKAKKEPELSKGNSIEDQIAAKEAEIAELRKAQEGSEDPLIKAITEQTQMLSSFMSSSKEQNEELSKGMEELNSKFTEVEERLETVEGQSTGRKTVTAKPLEKGFGGEEAQEDGVKRLSISRNKADLLNFLEVKSGLSKGNITDEAYANAMAKFESANVLDKGIISRLQVEDNIVLVP